MVCVEDPGLEELKAVPSNRSTARKHSAASTFVRHFAGSEPRKQYRVNVRHFAVSMPMQANPCFYSVNKTRYHPVSMHQTEQRLAVHSTLHRFTAHRTLRHSHFTNRFTSSLVKQPQPSQPPTRPRGYSIMVTVAGAYQAITHTF